MKYLNFLRASLCLAVIIVLASLFYLPYQTVKQETIETYNKEQFQLARQSATGMENVFAMYGMALNYYSTYPSDAGRGKLMEDEIKSFYLIHQPDLVAIVRTAQDGKVLFRIPDTEIKTLTDEPDELISRITAAYTGPRVNDIPSRTATLVTFSWPVFHNDVNQGNLTFIISFNQLVSKYMKPLKSIPGKRTWLINRDGIILNCPKQDHAGAHISKTTQTVEDTPLLLSIMQQMIQGGQGSGTFTFREEDTGNGNMPKNHVVFLPVNLPGNNIWSIAVATPEKDLLRNMNHFRDRWLLAASIAIAVLILLSFFLCKFITHVEDEKKRRGVEAQLTELIDFTPIGIVVLDLSGKIKYANRAVYSLFQIEGDTALPDINVFHYIHPDHLHLVNQRFKAVLKGKTSEPAVIKVVMDDGHEKNIEISTAPFTFAGEPCSITVIQDVSERLKAEAEHRRLATAIENTNDSVLITDTQGVIQYTNPAFTRVSGYSKEEAFGNTPRILKSGHHNQAMYSRLWETILQGKVWEGRLVNRRKNGSLFTEFASISPVLDNSGTLTNFVAVKRDISHEVSLEAQLQQAQKMEAIGTLAGGIAHDFNNILGAIVGFTDISILQCDRTSPIYDNLLHIRNSGKRAADLVQQILTFSRQATISEKMPVDVAPLVKETVKLLRASLPTTIKIDLDIQEADAWILGDPVQIQQVIMNLSTNAFHAMSEKGGILTIRLNKLPVGECHGTLGLADSSCLELQVMDTGHGIDQTIVDRIFDPFFTTKEPGVGTGMGLSVVHGIVRDLEGMITVDSDPEGSCFTILLPLAEPPEQKAALEEKEIPTGRESILFVDDEKDIRDTSEMMLRQLGYQVTTASHPRLALELVKNRNNHFDLVITDQTMPDMTGLELLSRIAQVDPDLPVILCTGFSEHLNEKTALQKGARKLLTKPVNYRQIGESVREVLDA